MATILYTKRDGIPVEIPDTAITTASGEYTLGYVPLVMQIKNYDPDVPPEEIKIQSNGVRDRIEIILENTSDSPLQIKYGELGSEVTLPSIPPKSKRSLIVDVTP